MSNNYSQSPLSLLPPTSNLWLQKGGDIVLYNPTLLLAANALFQHAAVFGFIFLLRGFSARRALDLHFLTIIFAISFIAAPLVFLVDTRIDSVKLWFFLEHEAIEYLIAIRVLAPINFLRHHSGLVLFVCWSSLSTVSILVSLNADYSHGADVIAWGAFTSDTLISISGCVLMARWYRDREYGKQSGEKISVADRFRRRQTTAEAMAGVGFCLHGLSTVTIAPILNRVLYHNLDPAYFAYAWVIVFFFAFFTVALSVPVAAIFFSTINWCFWHDRRILPGEARWTGEDIEAGDRTEFERKIIRERSNADRLRHPQTFRSAYWTSLAEKHTVSAG